MRRFYQKHTKNDRLDSVLLAAPAAPGLADSQYWDRASRPAAPRCASPRQAGEPADH